MTTLPATAPVEAPSAPIHPTPCPPWCADRAHPAFHHFGPSMTAHCSPEQSLPNLSPLPGGSRFLLHAELMRTDEGANLGETVMYVQGASDAEMSPDEADMFIADLDAFVTKLRVMRRQMS